MTVQEKRDRRVFESLLNKYGKDEIKSVLKEMAAKNISEGKEADDDIEIVLTD
jgi:hypothetical protein